MIPSSNENSVHLLDSFTNINGGAVECPMSKDDTCFDANYTCSSCCATEKAVNGALCWDGVFTKARCCENTEATQQVNTPPAAPPTYTPPAGTPICAKDPSCFDANYECTGCCSTGLAKNGVSCWDSVYTIEKCCHSMGTPAVVAPTTPAVVAPTGDVDQFPECPLWAELGQCALHEFMRKTCPISCGLKPLGEQLDDTQHQTCNLVNSPPNECGHGKDCRFKTEIDCWMSYKDPNPQGICVDRDDTNHPKRSLVTCAAQ